MDLAHGAADGEGGQLEDPQRPLGAVDVGVDRVPGRPLQLVLVVEQLAHPDLLLELAHEVLLARGAHVVRVGVAKAHVVERLLVAQLLIAGLDVDRGVAGVGGHVVATVDVRVDAAHRVHGALEAAEVDVDDVVDLDAQEAAHGGQRQLVAPEGERGVDLLRPRALMGNVDRHLQVAGDRQDRGLPGVGVHAHQHHRVRVGRLAAVDPLGARAAVGPDHHDRLGSARIAGAQLTGDAVAGGKDLLGDVGDLEQGGGGGGGRGHDHDRQRGQGKALPHPPRRGGRAVVKHLARPPGSHPGRARARQAASGQG